MCSQRCAWPRVCGIGHAWPRGVADRLQARLVEADVLPAPPPGGRSVEASSTGGGDQQQQGKQQRKQAEQKAFCVGALLPRPPKDDFPSVHPKREIYLIYSTIAPDAQRWPQKSPPGRGTVQEDGAQSGGRYARPGSHLLRRGGEGAAGQSAAHPLGAGR